MKKLIIFGMILVFASSFSFAQKEGKKPNFFQKGMEHYKAQEFDQAITNFRKVVNAPGQNPKKADAHFYLGMSFRKTGQPDAALEHFNGALEKRPGYMAARKERADLHIEQKRYDQAAADLTTILEAEPDNVQAGFQMGVALCRLEKYQESLNHLAKVIETDPQHAYAHYYSGLDYYKMKQYGRMSDHFQTFLRLAPDAPEAAQVKEILSQIQG